MDEDKEKAINKLLYKDKREEFLKFVESLKQRNGHLNRPSTSSTVNASATNALDTARNFIPAFRQDTDDLVTKISDAQRSDASGVAADILRKDVVSIEQDDLAGSIAASKKASGKKSKKRRHNKALFKSEVKKSGDADDGLVPVNVFLCEMKSQQQQQPQTANKELITMVTEPIDVDTCESAQLEQLPSHDSHEDI